jgi:SAM-dependent methyltransferase
MSIKLNRNKPKSWFLSIMYNLNKLIPLSDATKLKIFLNLEWFFDRMSHEYSFKNYTPDTHPVRIYTKEHLLNWIKTEHRVLDLGCHEGQMSIYIAEKATQVVGIDYNAVAIAEAQKAYQRDNLSFHCMEAYDYLTTTKTKFDVLILSHILEHLDSPDEFIQKFSGFFDFVYIELPDFDKTLLNHYRRDFKLPLIYTDGDHITEFDRFDLVKLVEKNNLTVVHSIYMHGLQKLWCKVNKNQA